MPFELYIPTRQRSDINPWVYYNGSSKRFFINIATVREFNLEKYKYCQFAYDKENKLVAFMFSFEDKDNHYKISNHNGLAIHGKAFVTRMNIPIEINKRYNLKYFENDIYYIDLKE